MPYFIASVAGLLIRSILPVGNLVFFLISEDLNTRHAEEGTTNFEMVLLGRLLHATETSGSTSAKKIKKTRFHLIIGMVREEEALASMA